VLDVTRLDGIHDLGGMDGFGPVEVERGEPVFHAEWERRIFGLAAAFRVSGLGNVHQFRHAIERMDPVHYLGSPYYEHWLTALATLGVEKGIVTREELERAAAGGFRLSAPPRIESLPEATPSPAAPRFAVGDRVRVRNLHRSGHTRCPRYVRGKRGVVVRVDRTFPLPDVAAHSDLACEEHAYGVRFEARELWGRGGGGEVIHVDLWESYLEAAP
jgi:nitrile hydratase subunit beta